MMRADVDEDVATGEDAPGQSPPSKRRRSVRRRSVRRRRDERRRRITARVVVFAVLGAGVVGLLAWLLSWWSPVPIREVVVIGAEGATADAVRAAAAIPTGASLRDLDRSAIEERVGALPGVDTVRLEIQRPWTVVVDVLERFPFAVVTNGNQWTVIDVGGVEINDQKDKPTGLPVLGEVADRTPVLAALAALPPELREKVQKGTVDKDGDVLLTLKSGVEIRWGLPGPDDAEKAQAVAVLLQYKPEEINVSVPQRPALTGELSLPKQNTVPSEAP